MIAYTLTARLHGRPALAMTMDVDEIRHLASLLDQLAWCRDAHDMAIELRSFTAELERMEWAMVKQATASMEQQLAERQHHQAYTVGGEDDPAYHRELRPDGPCGLSPEQIAWLQGDHGQGAQPVILRGRIGYPECRECGESSGHDTDCSRLGSHGAGHGAEDGEAMA